jgi:ATPase family AAA domain-containing protein 3A/B
LAINYDYYCSGSSAGGPAGAGGPGGPGKPVDDKSSRMAYSFDSAALERAAKAAKDLEKSGNAKEALELSKMQEVTKQKEYEVKAKVTTVRFNWKV